MVLVIPIFCKVVIAIKMDIESHPLYTPSLVFGKCHILSTICCTTVDLTRQHISVKHEVVFHGLQV